MLKAEFNKGKQFVEIILDEELESYGTFKAEWDNPKVGRFGVVRFSPKDLTFDTVVHEAFHVLVEYIVATRSNITSYNEEKYAILIDEIFRNMVKALCKEIPKIIL